MRNPISLIALVVLLSVTIESTHAADYLWDGSANVNWSNANNWTPATVPGAGNRAIFDALGSPNASPSEILVVQMDSIVFKSTAAAHNMGFSGWGIQNPGDFIIIEAGNSQDQIINVNRGSGFNVRFQPGTARIVHDGSGILYFGSTQTTATLGVFSSNGTLIVDGSGHTVLGSITIGMVTGNMALINGTAAGSVLNLQKDGAGTLTINSPASYTGATTVNNGILEYARVNQTNATTYSGAGKVRISSGVTNLNPNANFSSAFTGELELATGGVVYYGTGSTGLSASKGDLTVATNTSFTINASSIQVDALNGGGTIQNTASGTFAPAQLIIGANDGGGEFTGNIITLFHTVNGAISLTKTGIGTQTLSGNNTYTGTTAVNDGTLLVNGTHTAGGAYTVASGATLGGSGDIRSTVNLFGTISPGESPGTLMTDNFNWQSGGVYVWEINATNLAGGTVGSDPGWDLLDLEGSVLTFVGSSFEVDIVSLTSANVPGLADGFLYPQEFIFEIARADVIIGFDAANFTLNTGGFQNPDYRWSIFEENNSIYLMATPVPEPSSYLVFAFVGLICYGFVAYYRRIQTS